MTDNVYNALFFIEDPIIRKEYICADENVIYYEKLVAAYKAMTEEDGSVSERWKKARASLIGEGTL